jgi:membrane protein DedA with SNARE-associated domain
MELAVWVLIWVAILIVIGYAAHYIIRTFFPADLHMPALLIVGVILLVVLIVWVLGWPPSRPLLKGP